MSERGSTVAVFLFAVVLTGLTLLAVIGGRHVMCDLHSASERPSYCQPTENP